MADSPPDPDGLALWRRVVSDVRPLRGRRPEPVARQTSPATALPAARPAKPSPSRPAVAAKPSAPLRDTLDGGWDRRLAKGLAAPDATIDLHGHTVAAAHTALDSGIARAIGNGARVVLLVTGKPPPPGRSRIDDPLRGIIRASVEDWLYHSVYRTRIAAIRPAHPRHGGTGALYVVLRRVR